MHEYSKGHPMWRPQAFQLTADERQQLIAATVAGLTRRLGDGHQQITAFELQVKGMNDDRLVSVAQTNGTDDVPGIVDGILARVREERKARVWRARIESRS